MTIDDVARVLFIAITILVSTHFLALGVGLCILLVLWRRQPR